MPNGAQGQADASRFPSIRARTGVALALLAAVAVVYWPALGHGFIPAWDDAKYVLENPEVREGLSWHGVSWALRTFYASNWHPLTWWSHMADVQVFGLRPAGHHAVSLLLHAANAVLVLWLFALTTGRFWRAAVVAGLFALHPLRVESVAWIAERKDVLSGLFFLLTLIAYAGYARRPSAFRYGLAWTLFAVGLLAKPMLVTLPFVLLLFDVWPLGRFPLARGTNAAVSPLLLLGEKVPFLALSFASAVVTFLAQRAGGAMKEMDALGISERGANAAVAYVRYLGMTIWPAGLSPYYPHPGGVLPAWQWIGALALLVGISLAALAASRRRPYVATGWFMFAGMLVPVIGIVQVGSQAMADRYTYLPLIGIFVIVSWGGADLLTPRVPRAALTAAVCVLLLVLAGLARAQTLYWRDGVTLFTRAVVCGDSFWPRFNLAASLAEARRNDDAVAGYRSALELRPSHALTHSNLATVLDQSGRIEEAVAEYETALSADPRLAAALANLGRIRAMRGESDRALELFTRAATAWPDSPDARFNLATMLRRIGRLREAAASYAEALRLDPRFAKAAEGQVAALYMAGDDRAAWDALRRARRLDLRIDPALVQALSARTPEPAD